MVGSELNKEPKKTYSEIECPDCRGRNYRLLDLSITSFEYVPEYVEGRLVNENPNYFIQNVQCTICDVVFQQKM
jgi:ribosomal protein S27E